MQKISQYFGALRQIKDQYNWSVEEGRIVGRSVRGRSNAAPILAYVAAMRVVLGNPRLRSDRNIARRYSHYGPGRRRARYVPCITTSDRTMDSFVPPSRPPFHDHNHDSARQACRGMRFCRGNDRRTWVRTMTLKLLGITGQDEE